MFDWMYHTCPKCGGRSRKRIVKNQLKVSDRVQVNRKRWDGNAEFEEPYTVWLHSYEVEHACRLCGHRWVEHVTKQRPW